MTAILLVEDDASLGATLKERLTKEGYSATLASSRAEALRAVEKQGFDLYILDVGLPDGTGFELAQELPLKPFLFLTAQGDAESRLHGYELGAEEYIPKPFHLRELLLRVKHVLDNHAQVRELRLGEVRVDFAGYQMFRGQEVVNVASKDLELLKLLVEHAPRVVSRDQAVSAIRGEDKFPTNRTVDNAILRLRQALGEPWANQIESVRGVGYRWRGEKL